MRDHSIRIESKRELAASPTGYAHDFQNFSVIVHIYAVAHVVVFTYDAALEGLRIRSEYIALIQLALTRRVDNYRESQKLRR